MTASNSFTNGEVKGYKTSGILGDAAEIPGVFSSK